MTLYILSYNNYYNRIVKKENTFSDYASYIIYGPVQGVYGFTPGDGVNTTQILGSNVQMYSGQGDYLLAVTEEGVIDSRWFIIDTKRERNGQWTLTLHRDLVVDFYDEVLESPMFIEKATINDIDNSLLFNIEDMSFNQIKTNETLLRDGSGVAWLVGYYGKDTPTERLDNITIETNSLVDIPFYEINQEIENWEYYQYSNLAPDSRDYSGSIIDANYYIKYYVPQGFQLRFRQRWTVGTWNLEYFENDSTLYIERGSDDGNLYESFTASALQNLNSLLPSYFETNDESELFQFNGKLIKAGSRYFECVVYEKNTKESVQSITAGSMFNALATIASAHLSGTPNSDSFTVNCVTREFGISLAERFDLEATVDLSSTSKLITEDSPYNMFAIPFGELNYSVYTGSEVVKSFKSSKEIAIATARAIQRSLQQGSYLYDLQLLPYCPIQEEIDTPYYEQLQDGLGYMVCQSEEFGKKYSPIMGPEDSIIGFVYYIPKSSFSFILDYSGYAINQATSSVEKKLNNACDKWRLCSPNYSNYFDFSAEKNKGVSYWDVDCDYKPYNPYIHINPNFGGLYGKDYNDPRGLILGGDFSISATTSAWEQYEIQNKNFQLTFDRQIQNMEVQHKAGRIQDIVGGITGTFTGTLSGAGTGALIGGPIGAAIGAGAGALSSAAGGIGDYFINEMLRNEAIEYTEDQFGYQLGNIQALPDTLSKVTTLNQNNKLFPVLEYYTCTNIEKEAFINKLAYNGMSIGVIGLVSDYINNRWSYTINNKTIESKGYIKGQLIRLEETEDDYHIVNSLAGELNKGVYIK